MLKQLRIRFVSVAMAGMLLVTIMVVGTINGINYYNMVRSVHGMLDLIAYNDGKLQDFYQHDNHMIMPEPPMDKENPEEGNANPRYEPEKDFFGKPRVNINDETPFTTRFFVAYFAQDGSLLNVNMDNIASFTMDEAKSIAQTLGKKEYGYGKEKNYFYLYKQKNDGSILIYLDCGRDMETIKNFLFVSLVVAVISLLVEMLILILLSKKVVKPVAESVMKQKEFITDASHELKTPLTIISANTEVLEMTEGKNEWIDSIKNQTSRMTKLVNDMVFLAKTDEEKSIPVMERFDLTQAFNEVTEAFVPVAKTNNIDFQITGEEDLYYEGDENSIRQLFAILLDNAVKYVDEKGVIKTNCFKRGKKIYFQIYNTCQVIDKENLELIFERFYRIDKSRSRQTGGSGIGLSIAKAIVNMHKGMSIKAINVEDGIEFTVIMK